MRVEQIEDGSDRFSILLRNDAVCFEHHEGLKGVSLPTVEANYNAIAAARNVCPALIAELRRLRGDVPRIINR